jgi:hypothetical protein
MGFLILFAFGFDEIVSLFGQAYDLSKSILECDQWFILVISYVSVLFGDVATTLLPLSGGRFCEIRSPTHFDSLRSSSSTVIFETFSPTIQGEFSGTFCEKLQRKVSQGNFIVLFSGFRALVHRY